MRYGLLNYTVCRPLRRVLGVLATRGLPLARVNFGDGFCIPQHGRPMPHPTWWMREKMVRVQTLMCTFAELDHLRSRPVN